MGKDGDKSEMYFYNGFTAAQMGDPYGLEEARHREAEAADHPRHLVDDRRGQGRHDGRRPEITVADVRGIAAPNMQESDIKPGDAIFFNTGWGL
jgi:hypothetical protein